MAVHRQTMERFYGTVASGDDRKKREMNRRNFAGIALAASVAGVHAVGSLHAQSTPALSEDKQGLFGNAHDLVPLGEGKGVEIVSIGGFHRENVQVIICNNTTETVNLNPIAGTARDNRGALIRVWDGGDIVPREVVAGGIAIASVNFGGGNNIDPTWEYELEAKYDHHPSVGVNLTISEVVVKRGLLSGFVKNDTDEVVEGPIKVLALLFSNDGSILGYAAAYTDKYNLAVGEASPVIAPYYSDAKDIPDRFLIGASGFAPIGT